MEWIVYYHFLKTLLLYIGLTIILDSLGYNISRLAYANMHSLIIRYKY